MRLLCLALLALGLLAGCGQKGPLFLPRPEQPAPAPTSSVPEPESIILPQPVTIPPL
ncbi:MAG TPA: lipoprotein [Gammaproteobacteria bacterium]|nr:lipoprotein [Gammaproteobacteria bacterium]